MYYSHESLDNLQSSLRDVRNSFNRLSQAYAFRTYNNDTSKEYATQGYSRRLSIILRCVENVFVFLPPDSEEIPSRENVQDAIINIQTIVFNAFGCLDNLAKVWVTEKNVTGPNGVPFPPSWIGLRSVNTAVRNSFSPEFQAYLVKMDTWMEYLENFRHALAHRIPLYIPPFSVTRSNSARYEELDRLRNEALFQRGDVDTFEQLTAEQDGLRFFQPHMTHSFTEGAEIMVVHGQILADLNTVLDIGEKFLAELDRP